MDGITRPQFQRYLFHELRTLQRELATRQYKPQPIRITTLKKADGSCYPIGILAVRDRVAQHAVLNVIEPLFKAGAVISEAQRFRYPGQHSVFECLLDQAALERLIAMVEREICENEDPVGIYFLCRCCRRKSYAINGGSV